MAQMSPLRRRMIEDMTIRNLSPRANALNCRGIVGTGNPEPLAPTSWWG